MSGLFLWWHWFVDVVVMTTEVWGVLLSVVTLFADGHGMTLHWLTVRSSHFVLMKFIVDICSCDSDTVNSAARDSFFMMCYYSEWTCWLLVMFWCVWTWISRMLQTLITASQDSLVFLTRGTVHRTIWHSSWSGGWSWELFSPWTPTERQSLPPFCYLQTVW